MNTMPPALPIAPVLILSTGRCVPMYRIVIALSLGLACTLRAADTSDHFSDNGYGKTVSNMQHPAAEYFNGVTYVAYQGPHEDPYVAAYTHATGTWAGPVRAGVNLMGLSPDQVDPGALDNHGRPALVVDGQGYIHLIFGGHGGSFLFGENKFGTPGSGRQTHVVTEKPGDISSWKVLDNVPPFGTYGQWVKLANNDLYLFYRHGAHRSDWVYQKSIDHARSFAPPVSVLKHKVSEAGPTLHDSWYAWFDNGRGDTITASYVYHPCLNPAHNAHRQNTYFMLMDTRDASWTNVQGQKVSVPVTKESADQHTLILATGTEKSNHGTCHIDSEGHPHLFFRFPGGTVRYFRWDGEAWQKPTTVKDAGEFGRDGDFIIDSPLKVRMLLSHASNGTGSVGWWNTTDGGLTWARGESLISLPGHTFETSALVRNGPPEARMLVGGIKDQQSHLYHNMYLIGDHGAIGRPTAETNHLGDRLESIKAMPPSNAKAEAKRRTKAALGD